MKKFVLSIVTALLLSCVLTGAAFAGFAEGKSAYDRKDWKKAIENLRPAAEAGDAPSMVLLANMYNEGFGVKQDLKESFALYHRAAVLNNASGMLAVGSMYQRGLGTAPNGRLSFEWFKRSALLGHQTGAFFYAVSLYQGVKGKTFDIPAKHAEAFKWFRVAAKTGKSPSLQGVAAQIADNIAKKLTPEELSEASKQVADWKPALPVELGPLPEEVLQKELETKKAPAAPAASAEAKPEEKTEEPKAEEKSAPNGADINQGAKAPAQP